MIDNIFYAKKLILPSLRANTLQSLQMAAAFSATGKPTFFFPGIRLSDKGGARDQGVTSPRSGRGAETLAHLLELRLKDMGLGEVPEDWRALPAGHKGLYGLRFRLNAARIMRCQSATLLYARDLGEASFISALRRWPCFRQRGSKFVFEMHELLFQQHRDLEGRSDWRATRKREGAILAAVDALVVTNMDIAHLASSEYGFQGPVLEEPNGFNEALFRPVELFTERAPWPGENQPLRLVYIGSMKPGKGVRTLLRAMALLPGRFYLSLIGPAAGKTGQELRELVNAVPGGQERIKLVGHVPQTDIFEQCRGAHMALLPQQEGGGYFSPLKLNEALALGLPVVCTPLDIFARQKELGHQSRDCTPEGLAGAIAELAALPERARELRAKGLLAAARHSWRARAARILDFAGGL